MGTLQYVLSSREKTSDKCLKGLEEGAWVPVAGGCAPPSVGPRNYTLILQKSCTSAVSSAFSVIPFVVVRCYAASFRIKGIERRL